MEKEQSPDIEFFVGPESPVSMKSQECRFSPNL